MNNFSILTQYLEDQIGSFLKTELTKLNKKACQVFYYRDENYSIDPSMINAISFIIDGEQSYTYMVNGDVDSCEISSTLHIAVKDIDIKILEKIAFLIIKKLRGEKHYYQHNYDDGEKLKELNLTQEQFDSLDDSLKQELIIERSISPYLVKHALQINSLPDSTTYIILHLGFSIKVNNSSDN